MQLGTVHDGVGRGAIGIPVGQFAGGGGGGPPLISVGGNICSAVGPFTWALSDCFSDRTLDPSLSLLSESKKLLLSLDDSWPEYLFLDRPLGSLIPTSSAVRVIRPWKATMLLKSTFPEDLHLVSGCNIALL
jgi:hypothetical protein